MSERAEGSKPSKRGVRSSAHGSKKARTETRTWEKRITYDGNGNIIETVEVSPYEDNPVVKHVMKEFALLERNAKETSAFDDDDHIVFEAIKQAGEGRIDTPDEHLAYIRRQLKAVVG